MKKPNAFPSQAFQSLFKISLIIFIAILTAFFLLSVEALESIVIQTVKLFREFDLFKQLYNR